VSCDGGHRCGLDLALLWLWCRPAATAPIRPLAWEPPYTEGATLKSKNKERRKWRSSLVEQEVKDAVILLLWLGPQLCGFDPWPGNFRMPAQSKEKKKKEK